MSTPAHRCVLVRHGETEWSLDGRHTGRTDLPLLPEGVEQAKALRPLLSGRAFAAVLTSPLRPGPGHRRAGRSGGGGGRRP